MQPDIDERFRSVTTERLDLDPQEVCGGVALAVSVTTRRSSDSEVSSASIRRREFLDVVVRIVSESSALMSAVTVGVGPDCPLMVKGQRS